MSDPKAGLHALAEQLPANIASTITVFVTDKGRMILPNMQLKTARSLIDATVVAIVNAITPKPVTASPAPSAPDPAPVQEAKPADTPPNDHEPLDPAPTAERAAG